MYVCIYTYVHVHVAGLGISSVHLSVSISLNYIEMYPDHLSIVELQANKCTTLLSLA